MLFKKTPTFNIILLTASSFYDSQGQEFFI